MNLYMQKIDKEYWRLLLFRTLGNFMILASLIIISKTFLPIIYQEGLYYYRQFRKIQVKVINLKTDKPIIKAKPANNAFSGFLNRINQKEEILIPKDTNFSILIPKIGANTKVVVNVDSSNYEDYASALKTGVAHARGTSLPGDKGHIYLFAHSTDSVFNINTYNAVFYLLYKLENNDPIIIFYHGKKYLYKVIGQKIINPTDIEYLTRQTDQEFLTLQTCWPPGTTLQRLLVFAVPVLE